MGDVGIFMGNNHFFKYAVGDGGNNPYNKYVILYGNNSFILGRHFVICSMLRFIKEVNNNG